MRSLRPVAALVLVAALAGCGGAAARTYTRAQAYRILAVCMRGAGATDVTEGSGDRGTASFGPGDSIQWNYVMSAAKVADVFFSETGAVSSRTRARLDLCLKPHGWSLGS